MRAADPGGPGRGAVRSPDRVRCERRGGAGALLTAGLVLAAATGGLALGGPGAAAAPEQLRLTRPALSGDRTLTVSANIPDVLSSLPVDPGAFTAAQGERQVPVTSTRLLAGPTELVIVLDTNGDPLTVGAEQAAASDLLRALPPELPTTVLPGGSRTTARQAFESVGAVTRGFTGLLDGLPAATAAPRIVVLLAGCAALDAERRPLAGPGTEVFVLAPDAGCGAAALRLSGADPGAARLGLGATGLLGATDEVARDLLGRYVLQIGPGLTDEPVQVTVRVGSAVAAATTTLAPQAAPLAGPRTPGGGSPAARLVAAGLLTAMVVVPAGFVLRARRRSRSA